MSVIADQHIEERIGCMVCLQNSEKHWKMKSKNQAGGQSLLCYMPAERAEVTAPSFGIGSTWNMYPRSSGYTLQAVHWARSI